jgi:outer membrane lipoprotein SlyB
VRNCSITLSYPFEYYDSTAGRISTARQEVEIEQVKKIYFITGDSLRLEFRKNSTLSRSLNNVSAISLVSGKTNPLGGMIIGGCSGLLLGAMVGGAIGSAYSGWGDVSSLVGAAGAGIGLIAGSLIGLLVGGSFHQTIDLDLTNSDDSAKKDAIIKFIQKHQRQKKSVSKTDM